MRAMDSLTALRRINKFPIPMAAPDLAVRAMTPFAEENRKQRCNIELNFNIYYS